MLQDFLIQTGGFKGLRRFLGDEVLRYLGWGSISGVFLFIVEFAFAWVLQSFLQAIGILAQGSEGETGFFASYGLMGVLIAMFLVGALRSLVQWGHVYFSNAASEAMKFKQRSRILHWAFYGRSVSSAKVSTLFNENAWAAAACVGNLQSVAIYLPSILLLWASLVFLSPIPTILATLLLGLLALFLRIIDRKISFLGARIALVTNETNASVLRNIKNLLLVKIYGTQDRELRSVGASVDRYYRDMIAYGRLSGMKYALPQLLGIGMLCALAYFTTKWGGLKSGILVTYFYLFVRFVQNVGEASKTLASFKLYGPQTLLLASWWRDTYAKELEEKRALLPAPSNHEPFLRPIGWRLSGVSFSYSSGQGDVIKNFTENIPPGSVWVITGPSGAGKSTLRSLLLGTSEPSQGSIDLEIDSTKTISLASARARLLDSVGYVGPESFLIEGTVKENLSYGLHQVASDIDIRNILDHADCGFVHSLPLGLEHRLTEQGEGLSAGQKQRLALARALLRKPKVLVLDEATANLDTETELRLVATLEKIRDGMTIVAVTHREALLRIATHKTNLGG
jgi:ABC-type multidrug transport system fused ATPase/permease subunit